MFKRRAVEWVSNIEEISDLEREISGRVPPSKTRIPHWLNQRLPVILSPGWVTVSLDKAAFCEQLESLAGQPPKRKVDDYAGNIDLYSGKGRKIIQISATAGYWGGFDLLVSLELRPQMGVSIGGHLKDKGIKNSTFVSPTRPQVIAALELLRAIQREID